jgi:hypothetical protein
LESLTAVESTLEHALDTIAGEASPHPPDETDQR